LVYLGTLSNRFSLEELAGANLVAGVLLVALGVSGFGARIMRWLPLPIAMGMFGGSILEYVTRMVTATVADATVAGTTVGCYLLGRFINSPRLPPVGLAVIGGGIAVASIGTVRVETLEWALPSLVVPGMDFSIPAAIAVSLPMVVMAMGLGNIQGLGFLMAQGYRVPVNAVSTVVGVASVVNALFGGHAATIARTGVAILASPDAGPLSGRYWASVIAAALTIVLACASTPVASLLNALPTNYVLARAGVAIMSSLQDALEKSFGGHMRFGALVGFAVAATPFTIFGITSAFWAIIAGVLASAVAERQQLLAFWKQGRASGVAPD
jgi:benzoate membrane transport protein